MFNNRRQTRKRNIKRKKLSLVFSSELLYSSYNEESFADLHTQDETAYSSAFEAGNSSVEQLLESPNNSLLDGDESNEDCEIDDFVWTNSAQSSSFRLLDLYSRLIAIQVKHKASDSLMDEFCRLLNDVLSKPNRAPRLYRTIRTAAQKKTKLPVIETFFYCSNCSERIETRQRCTCGRYPC